MWNIPRMILKNPLLCVFQEWPTLRSFAFRTRQCRKAVPPSCADILVTRVLSNSGRSWRGGEGYGISSPSCQGGLCIPGGGSSNFIPGTSKTEFYVHLIYHEYKYYLQQIKIVSILLARSTWTKKLTSFHELKLLCVFLIFRLGLVSQLWGDNSSRATLRYI